MRAKRILEGYSPSMNYGNKSMVRTSVNRFGRVGGKLSNTMPYVYRVLQFNHSLEQAPTFMDNFNPIKMGDIILGKQFVNTKDKKTYKGIVTSVKKTVDGIVERVGIKHKGVTLWLDPNSIISVHNDNNIDNELVLFDDSMEFEE